MKKTLFIVLLIIGSFACQNKIIMDGEVAIKVEEYDETRNKYSTDGGYGGFPSEETSPSFVAPIGLYNVKDTVHFCK